MEREWMYELDYLEFKYKGYNCKIRRVEHVRHLCGYVLLPKEHYLYGKEYCDIDIDCHGGLSYSEKENEYWVIGFDCAHACDLIPGLHEKAKSGSFGIYRNMGYVKSELRKIVNQIIEMEGANQWQKN